MDKKRLDDMSYQERIKTIREESEKIMSLLRGYTCEEAMIILGETKCKIDIVRDKAIIS